MYIVRSKINPFLILCTNGQFFDEDYVGPGHALSAKTYKSKRAANEVLNGQVIIEEYGYHKTK